MRRNAWAPVAVLFASLLAVAAAAAAASANVACEGADPKDRFNRFDRLDVNGADEYDFMDVDEIDYLRALKLTERRRETGEYARVEDLTDVLPADLFGMISDTVEVGSFRGPRDAFYTGNSFSDVRWYMDRDRNYAWRGLYNFHLSNRVSARIAYDKGTGENNLSFDEVFLNYYQWSDGFFPKDKVTVPRPKAEVRAKIEEGYEDLEQRVLADFNSRYGHEMSIGRLRKKTIAGLYETDLESWQKHWLTKKPVAAPKRKRKPRPEAPAPPPDRTKPLLPYKMGVPPKKEKEAADAKDPVMTGIWSFGSVMFPEGPRPLIDLHRTLFKGIKYERIFDAFRAGMLYKKDDDRELQVIGGNAWARVNDGNTIVGAKANRIYSRAKDNDIQDVMVYAMGDANDGRTHLYGEMENVFDGATQVYGLMTSRFRDTFITTKIRSVKENWNGPNAVAPFSFDGEFTSHLRLSYLFSGISSISCWTEHGKVYDGDPDVELGARQETGTRLFLKPTEKALFSIGYRNVRNVTGFVDDVYLGRLRYRYRPRLDIFLTTEFTDRDVKSRLGQLSQNSIEFRYRARDNFKVNLEFIDKWDQALAGTDGEHEGIGRINYYYNF